MASTNKQPRGRPKGTVKPDSLRQSGVHFTLRLSSADLLRWKKLAKKRKTTLAEVIRSKLIEWENERRA